MKIPHLGPIDVTEAVQDRKYGLDSLGSADLPRGLLYRSTCWLTSAPRSASRDARLVPVAVEFVADPDGFHRPHRAADIHFLFS